MRIIKCNIVKKIITFMKIGKTFKIIYISINYQNV